jgi:hypothetical protein
MLPGGREKHTKASRASWLLHRGPIGVGLFVCHTCDNKGCVNPDHLYLGTHEDNTRDAMNRERYQMGEKRYNFAQSNGLADRARDLRRYGCSVEAICDWLEIGRNTYYRMVRSGKVDRTLNRRAALENYKRAASAR